MAHINVEAHLPGVTGLLEYRRDTAEPLRELTHILLRGSNTLSEAERELIATAVSGRNGCVYCTTSHAAAADAYYGNSELSNSVRIDVESAPISEKMKALLAIALHVQENGKKVTEQSIRRAKEAGAADMEIHDTVMIAALFCFYNRYVDGLGTYVPSDPVYYQEMAQRLKDGGYYRSENNINDLKHKNII